VFEGAVRGISAIATNTAHTDALDGVLASLAREATTAVGDLERMIAIDTSFPPGAGYAAFAELLEELARALGFDCRAVLVPRRLWHRPGVSAAGERINLIAVRRTGRPICGLYFHTDTVPPAADWMRPPFALTSEGSHLYGLGAADMKGSIAAAFLALRAACASRIELAYDPMLLFCTDEEGGLYPGIRYLAEQGLLEGHVLSFNGAAVPRIWAGCFGSINLLIRIHGRAAHAGDATSGVNAIEAALPLMNALAMLKVRVAKRRSALPSFDQATPLTGRLTIVSAHGGASGGAVPSRFEILVNRRYAPEETFDAALAEIQQAVEEASEGCGARVETMLVGHLAPVSDPTGPHWPRWQAALSRGFGWRPQEFRAWGATSSSDFGWVQRTGMREILLGGLGRPDRNVHAAEEHTTIEDVVALAQSILAYLAADFRPDILPESQRSSS
jgi:succinyl-diaminopimelate desuccinylase